ncbi:MAG: hypothetical protein WC721_19000 [Victivallaceae bacterium]
MSRIWGTGVQNVVKARKVESEKSEKSFEDIMFNMTPKHRS